MSLMFYLFRRLLHATGSDRTNKNKPHGFQPSSQFKSNTKYIKSVKKKIKTVVITITVVT
jgi:hypothetical protein